MKQATLATEMKIPQARLSRMENNKQEVSEEEIQKFAEVLHTTVEDLVSPVIPQVNIHNNSIKGNGYVHQQTYNGAELFQQAFIQFQEASQQMMAMVQEFKSDKEFLKDENRQLRKRDEKWMQMLMDMQAQLVVFLRKDRN